MSEEGVEIRSDSSDSEVIRQEGCINSVYNNISIENIDDSNICKLYINARFNGNVLHLNELVHIANNTIHPITNIAKGFYSVILHQGLQCNKSALITNKIQASRIMSEVMPYLLQQLDNVTCSSYVPLLLGYAYTFGIYVTSDKDMAFKYYQFSADQGNAVAQRNVGNCFSSGEGVMMDKFEAFRYYKLSADQGNSDAQSNVGNCYANGDSVPINKSEAFKYYQMSADQGNADAQCKVSVCYGKGDGVSMSKSEALRYYKYSCGSGRCCRR
jgi:NADPH-dependent 7-cyano-7-deazaguanine reductase QueF-like protein